MPKKYFGVNSYKHYKGDSIKEPLENSIGEVILAQDDNETFREKARSKFLNFFDDSPLGKLAYELYKAIYQADDEAIKESITTMEFIHRVTKVHWAQNKSPS